MNSDDKRVLEKNGWTIECESPFEIRHTDGSFATGQAARLVLEALMNVGYGKQREGTVYERRDL